MCSNNGEITVILRYTSLIGVLVALRLIASTPPWPSEHDKQSHNDNPSPQQATYVASRLDLVSPSNTSNYYGMYRSYNEPHTSNDAKY